MSTNAGMLERFRDLTCREKIVQTNYVKTRISSKNFVAKRNGFLKQMTYQRYSAQHGSSHVKEIRRITRKERIKKQAAESKTNV